MLELLSIDSFDGRVGESFRLSPPGMSSIETRLVAVTPAVGASDAARRGLRTPFSLTFRAPNGPPLPQRIYTLDHDAMGALELFLVPIGPDGEGMCYEAVFT